MKLQFTGLLVFLIIAVSVLLGVDGNGERFSQDDENDIERNESIEDNSWDPVNGGKNEQVKDDEADDESEDESKQESDEENGDVALGQPSNAQTAIPSVRTTADDISEHFLSEVAKGPMLAASPPAVDMMFVIHRSITTGQANVDMAVKFLGDLLKFFSVSPSTTRVAAVSYAFWNKIEFDFNDHVNRKCVNQALKKIRAAGRKTATNKALLKAKSVFKSKRRGARLDTAKSVVFLLIDAKSTGIKPRNQAIKLKGSPVNAEIFVLGIGSDLLESELNDIASSANHVFRVASFTDLHLVISELQKTNQEDSYKYCSWRSISHRQSRLSERFPNIIGTTSSIHFFDECNRRCKCKNNKLVSCCRVRKEFTSMSTAEKERYINAVKTASTTEPFKKQYDKFIRKHKWFFNSGIHQKREFLPWHRLFILELENILRQVDCRVTIPYWDWSLWSHDPWSTASGAVWHASNQGFGGNGSPPGGCVNTGPFRHPDWKMTNNQCLRRNFNGAPPDAAQVQICLSKTIFEEFELFLRVNLHNLVHCLISGTMCFGRDSANAPEFFLHHGFIDKIWADWQKKSATNENAFFPSISKKLRGSKLKPKDLINLQKQPGCVRVCYDKPTSNNAAGVHRFLKRTSVNRLNMMPRLPFSKVTSKSLNLFGVSVQERIKAKQLERNARSGIGRHASMLLRCSDRITGFDTHSFKRYKSCPSRRFFNPNVSE